MTQQQKDYLMTLVCRDTSVDVQAKQKQLVIVDNDIARITNSMVLGQDRLDTLEATKLGIENTIQNLLDIESSLDALVIV